MGQQDPIDVGLARVEEEPARTDLQLVPVHRQVGIDTLEQMQRRQEVLGILLTNALKKTTHRHWLDYGDTKDGKPTDPRPEDEAAVVIARDLGISWVWVPVGDEPGGFLRSQKSNGAYEIMVTIRGHCLGQFIEEIGTAASDDGLLRSSKRADTPGQRALESDVLKKARANALVRLVQAFGVRGVTWDDLAKAGIRREDCDRIMFAEGEASAAKTAARQAAGGKKCPKCGKPMTLRKRASDGSPFLGCTGYPVCRHIENATAAPKAAESPTVAAPPAETPAETPEPPQETPAEEDAPLPPDEDSEPALEAPGPPNEAPYDPAAVAKALSTEATRIWGDRGGKFWDWMSEFTGIARGNITGKFRAWVTENRDKAEAALAELKAKEAA